MSKIINGVTNQFFYWGSYNSPVIVVCSSGHGQNTAGKRTPEINGKVIKEFQFNQPTKLKLLAALERCGIACCDANYEATSKAIDVELETRVKRANSLIKKSADKKRIIYVEIHYNAYNGVFDDKKGGLEIFYYKGSSKGKELASNILDYLKNGTKQVNRGIKTTTGLYVVKYTLMPAILSENGFMDMFFEAKLMLNEDFQNEVAEEHCKGICDYFGLIYIPPKKESNKLYKVQVGAFSKKDNAEKLSNLLKKDGYPVYIVED